MKIKIIELEQFPNNLKKEGEDYFLKLQDKEKFHQNLIDCGYTYNDFIKVIVLSDFVKQYSLKNPNFLLSYFPDKLELEEILRDKVKTSLNDNDFMKSVRDFRNLYFANIIFQDTLRKVDVMETCKRLSSLASVCINCAYYFVFRQMITVFGDPKQHLSIIGMGKLGANELNLSSDVDLIFVYPSNGKTLGVREISNKDFFTKLSQRLIKLISEVTVDGFVFRIDMRLRPFGNSGAICSSYDSFLNYYQQSGSEWERYAMIKSSIIAGDLDNGSKLLNGLRSFVYRKYIDFSVFDSLRDMKSLIIQEVIRNNIESNIKLGFGGIREIEFIAQAFQLIYGGKDYDLQTNSLLRVLKILSNKYLPFNLTNNLEKSYLFLRYIEHALQINDEQTQNLPKSYLEQEKVALILGFLDYSCFLEELKLHRNFVGKFFQDFISQNKQDNYLEEVFKNINGDKKKEILEFQNCINSKITDKNSLNRINKFLPIFLNEYYKLDQHLSNLTNLLSFINSISRRSSYLVLLIENKNALILLLTVCSKSVLIVDLLSNYPMLIDELLFKEKLINVPNVNEIEQQLNDFLKDKDDFEEQLYLLRDFKLINFFKIAVLNILDILPLMKISDYLTFLAEAILNKSFSLAFNYMKGKFGLLPGISLQDPCFNILAYGKLGGIELSYSSDLDLVFIYDYPKGVFTNGTNTIETEIFYKRLTQRILLILQSQTSKGILYDIDLRLRPNGNSGLIISNLNYLKNIKEMKVGFGSIRL